MMRLPLVFCHWATEGISFGATRRKPFIDLREKGPYSSTEKKASSSPKFSNIEVILLTFSVYRGSLLVKDDLAFLHRYPARLIARRIVHNDVATPSVAMAAFRSMARQFVRAKP